MLRLIQLARRLRLLLRGLRAIRIRQRLLRGRHLRRRRFDRRRRRVRPVLQIIERHLRLLPKRRLLSRQPRELRLQRCPLLRQPRRHRAKGSELFPLLRVAFQIAHLAGCGLKDLPGDRMAGA